MHKGISSLIREFRKTTHPLPAEGSDGIRYATSEWKEWKFRDDTILNRDSVAMPVYR